MKKLSIVGLLLLVVGTLQVRAQGTINFVNSASELITIHLFSFGNGPAVNAASSVYGTRIQLYYQPGSVVAPLPISNSGLGNWVPLGGLGTNITTGGRFSVGTVTTGSDVPGGGSVWLEAVAWTGANHSSSVVYNSYSAALNDATVIFASSSVWNQLTGDPNAVPPTVAVNTSINGFGGVPLFEGPEPATITLLVLGGTSFLFLRRRK